MLSVAANKAFTPLQLQEVRALCKVQEMDRKEPEVDDLVKVLAETLETGTLEEVMEKTYDSRFSRRHCGVFFMSSRSCKFSRSRAWIRV